MMFSLRNALPLFLSLSVESDNPYYINTFVRRISDDDDAE